MKSLITIFLVFFVISSLHAGSTGSIRAEDTKRQSTFSGQDYSVAGNSLLGGSDSGLETTLLGNDGIPVLRSNPWDNEEGGYDPDKHGNAQGNTGAPIGDGWILMGILLLLYGVVKGRPNAFSHHVLNNRINK